MLQARYQHCAMMQPRPRYWPRELVAEQAVEEVRDMCDPRLCSPSEFIVPEGVRLPFMWWALSGSDQFAALDNLPGPDLQVDASYSLLVAEAPRDRVYGY
jgi:hypothetical protein